MEPAPRRHSYRRRRARRGRDETVRFRIRTDSEDTDKSRDAARNLLLLRREARRHCRRVKPDSEVRFWRSATSFCPANPAIRRDGSFRIRNPGSETRTNLRLPTSNLVLDAFLRCDESLRRRESSASKTAYRRRMRRRPPPLLPPPRLKRLRMLRRRAGKTEAEAARRKRKREDEERGEEGDEEGKPWRREKGRRDDRR